MVQTHMGQYKGHDHREDALHFIYGFNRFSGVATFFVKISESRTKDHIAPLPFFSVTGHKATVKALTGKIEVLAVFIATFKRNHNLFY